MLSSNCALYADHKYRTLNILKLMLPTLTLSLSSILFVILIYYVTFKNWLKQKQLAEMKSDFINSITHEFNTPLSTIIVANKSLQNNKILENKVQTHSLTKVIERQSLRLKTLFSQVLDITVMNKDSLQKKSFAVNDLLDEIVLDYKLRLSENKTEIKLIKSESVGAVNLDKFWFTTMLLNMFDNAIKYNNKRVKKIKVKTFIYDGTVAISIKDNGVGMSPEVLSHIFEKFYRVKDQGELRDVNGLGLGLFYAKQCIVAHEWLITLKSEVGVGTEIIILMD